MEEPTTGRMVAMPAGSAILGGALVAALGETAMGNESAESDAATLKGAAGAGAAGAAKFNSEEKVCTSGTGAAASPPPSGASRGAATTSGRTNACLNRLFKAAVCSLGEVPLAFTKDTRFSRLLFTMGDSDGSGFVNTRAGLLLCSSDAAPASAAGG